RGRTVADASLIELGLAVAGVLPFSGPANIQCRIANGRPTVFEMNPRFSGGGPLTVAAGADFPRLVVELALGRSIPAAIGEFRSNLWMTSYESSMFVDAERVAAAERTLTVAVGDVA